LPSEGAMNLFSKCAYAVAVATLLFGAATVGKSQAPSAPSIASVSSPKHFQRVLIVILENESYVSAIKDRYLKELAEEGVEFTDFHGIGHPSYPNYLAMIAGSGFGIHGMLGDEQKTFPDDNEHRTIADFLDWKNYAEDYPQQKGPYLDSSTGRYARKHVPFLSFEKIQKQSWANVVGVDTRDAHNAFISDVENSRKKPDDSKYKALPSYMLYSPNLDDDGHDTNLGTASTWLKNFLANWFPPEARSGTLIVVTFDESEQPEWASNHIYTVFLGDMVKKGQKVAKRYDHYDVLRTIEDNFGIQTPLNVGDSQASPISDIWN
jgi:hypothetical protein